MEQQKYKKVQMRVAKFLVLLLLINCSNKIIFHRLSTDAIGGSNSIYTEKSKSRHTKLCGIFYSKEFPIQVIPAAMTVNGVVIQSDSGKFNLDVMPGTFTITGGFIGRKWVLLEELNLHEGDSVFVEFSMEIDSRKLY